MRFELTGALINQLLFAMEDQGIEYVLNCALGKVLPLSELGEGEDPDAFEPIPEWQSADGFRLMENFAASLHNPVVRMELTDALERGRGVFRAFKDVLGAHPEVAKLWHVYKEREMRRRVFDWYNGLREQWGLERLGEEPEETEDLVLQDFRIRPAEGRDEEAARELHERSLLESCAIGEAEDADADADARSVLDPDRLEPWPLAGDAGRLALTAETSRGDFAGFALALLRERTATLAALEVCPEYRGLGLGELLLTNLLDALRASGVRSFFLDLPAASEPFARILARGGFRVFETRYRLDVGDSGPLLE